MSVAAVRVQQLEPVRPPVRALRLVPQPVPTWQQLSLTLDTSEAPRPDVPASTDPELAGLPDVDAWVRQLVVGLFEALLGSRPPQQLVRWLDPAVFSAVAAKCRTTGRPRTPIHTTVSTVHAQCPTPGIVEATAVVRIGNRFRAVALRLRADEGRWRCAAVQVV